MSPGEDAVCQGQVGCCSRMNGKKGLKDGSSIGIGVIRSCLCLLNSVVDLQVVLERFFGVIFTVITHVIVFLFGFIGGFFLYFCTVF